MVIQFSCSSCGKRLRVKDDFAGQSSKCPGCGWGVTVPMETEGPTEESSPPPVPVPLPENRDVEATSPMGPPAPARSAAGSTDD